MNWAMRMGVVIFWLLLLACITPGLLTVLLVLVFGWIFSAFRLFQGLVRFGPGLLSFFCFVSIAGVGVHWVCKWLATAWRGLSDKPASPWPWRRSAAAYGGGWLILFAVMSLMGIAHQIGWLAFSGQPFFKSRMSEVLKRIDLQRAADALSRAADQVEWDVARTRSAFNRSPSQGSRELLQEKFNLIFIDGTNGQFSTGIVVPVDSNTRMKYGVAIVRRAQTYMILRTNVEQMLGMTARKLGAP